MLTIGCHLSASKGYAQMARDAASIGANTFQFFTRNPRGCKAREIDPEDIEEFNTLCKNAGIGQILAHAPYTLNPCSAKPDVREFAHDVLSDDLRRMENTPNQMYNMHPGSHTGQGVDVGTQQIIDTLNAVLTPQQTTTVLLETMAGKGSEVGRNFEEVRAVLDGVNLRDKMGVCLDTCHVWEAGYDNVGALDGVLEKFDSVIGLENLRAIHLNDSKNPIGAHKDRHEVIGAGHIGKEALCAVINHPRLRHLPFYLETPNKELSGWAAEIKMLREAYVE